MAKKDGGSNIHLHILTKKACHILRPFQKVTIQIVTHNVS